MLSKLTNLTFYPNKNDTSTSSHIQRTNFVVMLLISAFWFATNVSIVVGSNKALQLCSWYGLA